MRFGGKARPQQLRIPELQPSGLGGQGPDLNQTRGDRCPRTWVPRTCRACFPLPRRLQAHQFASGAPRRRTLRTPRPALPAQTLVRWSLAACTPSLAVLAEPLLLARLALIAPLLTGLALAVPVTDDEGLEVKGELLKRKDFLHVDEEGQCLLRPARWEPATCSLAPRRSQAPPHENVLLPQARGH